MMGIHLDLDTDGKCFVLSGDTDLVSKNYRTKFFLRDYLKASFDSQGNVRIPYVDEDRRESILQQIHDSLAKIGGVHTDSPQIKNVLQLYYREKENFKAFSEKARGIWNNRVEAEDFKSFKETLDQYLPHRTLYDKQLLSAFHLAFSQNACNFSVPGAGKTSVVYAAYAYLKSLPPENPKHVNKLLIIGPLSCFGPWENEFAECFGRPVTSKRLSGGVPKQERERHLLSVAPVDATPELTLISYQSVLFEATNVTSFLQKKGQRVMVVLDEAHKIKNTAGGVWAQSVLGLAKFSYARVVLTGTPVPNGYEDIYNLYQFIWPGRKIIDFSLFQLRDMSANPNDARIAKLIDDIAPFFIRIRKKDLGLPPTEEKNPVIVQMGERQREIYDFIERKYVGYFAEKPDDLSFAAELTKARFIRLMQAATNPDLLRQPLEEYFREQGLANDLFIDDSTVITKILRYHESGEVPAKFVAVLRLVQNILAMNEKVIIWGTFIQNIKDLERYLASNGIAARILIGETPIERDDGATDAIETREKIVRDFHDAASPFRVLIANPFAVAESISLHKACHHAIYLERTFNAANFIQSKDRIHRYGLPPNVWTYYHYILSENSIDETIHARLIEKEARMNALLESQEIPLISANMDYDIDFEDDIKALIRDYVKRRSQMR